MNYQIMTDIVETPYGKGYVPDWQMLLDGAESQGERKMLYAKMKDRRNSDFAFSFKLIYVSRMKCGHYEIFQSPMPKVQSLENILQLAKAYAYDHKCTHCICKWEKHRRKRRQYTRAGQ